MCPKCHSHDLFQVTLRPAGEAVPFTTCRHCEHRWWGQAGQTVALDEVLARLG